MKMLSGERGMVTSPWNVTVLTKRKMLDYYALLTLL